MKKEQEQDKNFKISSDIGYTYDQFIKEILEKRGRFNCEENSYKERHHILPKSKGGDNSTENLIDLYGREHFIAHKLLAKENPSDKQLTFAWWMMAHCFGRDYQDRYQVSPEEYEEAKQKASIEISKIKTTELKKQTIRTLKTEQERKTTNNMFEEKAMYPYQLVVI